MKMSLPYEQERQQIDTRSTGVHGDGSGGRSNINDREHRAGCENMRIITCARPSLIGDKRNFLSVMDLNNFLATKSSEVGNRSQGLESLRNVSHTSSGPRLW